MTAARSAPSAHESDLMRAYQEAVPFALPNVRIFRRNIMAAHLSGGHFVRAGIPGQCDLYGYVKGGPVVVPAHTDASGKSFWSITRVASAIPIEIECKGARAKWTDQQKKWRAFCEEWRIPYLALEAHRAETPGATIIRWVEETRTMVGRLT